MPIPISPEGAAIINPPDPGRPAVMATANKINAQAAMKRLVRRCCTLSPQNKLESSKPPVALIMGIATMSPQIPLQSRVVTNAIMKPVSSPK